MIDKARRNMGISPVGGAMVALFFILLFVTIIAGVLYLVAGALGFSGTVVNVVIAVVAVGVAVVWGWLSIQKVKEKLPMKSDSSAEYESDGGSEESDSGEE